MTFLDHNSEEFLIFRDEILYRGACKAAECYLKNHEPVYKSQLYSIPIVVQGAGLAGLKKLAERQEGKNTSEKNKAFWTFIWSLLFERQGAAPLDFGLRALVENELGKRNLLQDEAGSSEKIQKKKIKKANSELIEKVMGVTVATYFEHFNCHYFYKTVQGGRNG
jgi:hypothetical protein